MCEPSVVACMISNTRISNIRLLKAGGGGGGGGGRGEGTSDPPDPPLDASVTGNKGSIQHLDL